MSVFPKNSTEAGIVIDVIPLQPLKAYSPIFFIVLGMINDGVPLQSLKAYLPMATTAKSFPSEALMEEGIVIVFVLSLEIAEYRFVPT